MDRKIDLTEHGDFQYLSNFLKDISLEHKVYPWTYNNETNYYLPWLPTKSKVLWQGSQYFDYLECKSMDEDAWISYPWDFENNQLCNVEDFPTNTIKRREIQSDLAILFR